VTTGANGANAVTYTDASPTGPEQFPYVGQMAAQIGDNRLLPPEAWLMRTARWAWLASAEDTATMPIVPTGFSPTPARPTPDGKPDPVSALLGWPVFPDDAIPATLGARHPGRDHRVPPVRQPAARERHPHDREPSSRSPARCRRASSCAATRLIWSATRPASRP
jgi:hypothetical protein